MLQQFNGILRYSNGKYELAVETTAPTIPSTLSLTTSASYTGSVGASTNVTTLPDPRIINQDDMFEIGDDLFSTDRQISSNTIH